MDQIFHILGATGHLIGISGTFTLESGYTFEGLVPNLRTAVQNYFDEVNLTWQNKEYLTVRISQIEAALINVEGVLDIENLTINDANSNISLGETEIATLGEIANA
jgi:uncharacterized phage protein gp47/JayE